MSGLFAAGSLHPSACNASGRNARKDDERALDCDGPTRRLAALAFAQDIVCLGYNASGAAWKCDRGVGGVSYESGGGAPWLPRAARPLGG